MAARKYNTQPWGHYMPHLEAWRRFRVLSQIELAEKSGVSNSYICKLEAGTKRAAPATISNIAVALRLSREQLIHDIPPSDAG